MGGLGARLLMKAGWIEGRGLGKYGQGRAEPIAASDHMGTTGLGFAQNVKRQTHSYQSQTETVVIEWKPQYIEDKRPPPQSVPESWLQLGMHRSVFG
jgi:hypothetical protein